MAESDREHVDHLDASGLTWAALLGQWVRFARAAVALPDDLPGRRMRDSVPDVIMLQAVWFSLDADQLARLSAQQRPLALDRAQVLIDKHVAALHGRWPDRSMPESLGELIDDVQSRLAERRRELSS